MNAKRSERGQVLVLIILAIVGIFGFAAIAVDGGRFYSERRRAQNAADAAALAAAYAGINLKDYRAAGIASTKINGYDDTDGTTGTTVVNALENVEVYRPPIRGRYSIDGVDGNPNINPNEYYQVIIYKNVEQILSQFVFGGGLWVNVEAVARGTGNGGFNADAAIVATCLDCCDDILFTGNADIHVKGGDVISNSTMDSTPPKNCDSFRKGADAGCVIIENGDAISAGSIYAHANTSCPSGNGLSAINILPKTPSSETYLFPYTPNCGDDDPSVYKTSEDKYNGTKTLKPGIYKKGISVSGNNSAITLQRGLYCLDGDFKVPQGYISGEEGVMFYMRETSSVEITTNKTVVMTAPGKDNCIKAGSPAGTPPQNICWSGFLFFMPYENGGYIRVAGGGDSKYTGTIYAPGPNELNNTSKCFVAGGSEADGYQLKGSIICYTVTVQGAKEFSVEYSPDTSLPATGVIEVTQ